MGALYRTVRPALQVLGHIIADIICHAYEAQLFAEPPPADKRAAAIVASADGAIHEGFTLLSGEITPHLIKAFKRHGLTVLQRFEIGAEVHHVVDLRAIAYAQQRAGELIRDFAQSTPEMLRGSVVQALEEGWSAGQLRDELLENQAFSHVRALAIARTEVANSYKAGGFEAAKVAEARWKIWDPDAGACALCLENFSQGWISMDQEFTNGLSPHPNCTCSISYSNKEAAPNV